MAGCGMHVVGYLVEARSHPILMISGRGEAGDAGAAAAGERGQGAHDGGGRGGGVGAGALTEMNWSYD